MKKCTVYSLTTKLMYSTVNYAPSSTSSRFFVSKVSTTNQSNVCITSCVYVECVCVRIAVYQCMQSVAAPAYPVRRTSGVDIKRHMRNHCIRRCYFNTYRIGSSSAT